MRERGYIELRDYKFGERYAEGNLARLPALAEELARLRPDVIVAGTMAGALAAMKITSSIPIVGNSMTDPVAMGLAKSEARPGGNVTGTVIGLSGLPGKQLETGLLLVPGAEKVGVFVNPGNPATRIYLRDLESSAAKLGVELKTIEVHSAADIGSAFQNLMSERVLILFVAPDDVCHSSPADRCLRIVVAWLPNVFYLRENVQAGSLVSYGINLTAMYHRAACLLRGQDTEGRKAR